MPQLPPQAARAQGDVRLIPLGDGFYAYVDAADYEWLSQWSRHMCSAGYAARYEKGKGRKAKKKPRRAVRIRRTRRDKTRLAKQEDQEAQRQVAVLAPSAGDSNR